MSDTATMSFPQAARHLGVKVRALRDAIRAGTIPAPPQMGATASLPAEWLARAQAAATATPGALRASRRPKVPAFARYEGTSCWRKYRSRVREYTRFKDAASG